MATIVEGITVGAAGGALAGITVYVLQYIHELVSVYLDKRTIHNWLQENTSTKKDEQFCSTKQIASWTNLTLDRVQYICSKDKRIALVSGGNADLCALRVNHVVEVDYS